ALADLHQAIVKGFDDVEQMKNEPKLDPLRSRDDFTKLLTEFKQEIKSIPASAETWALRGDRSLRTKQFANMAEAYSEAVRLRPQVQWYWHERAYAYMMLGEHKKAIADLTTAIELTDRDADQRLRRGQSYDALGEFQNAELDYSRAIELDPAGWRGWY